MQRPTAVTVFGILNIAFAGWGVLGLVASLTLFTLQGSDENPVLKLMRDNPAYTTWMKLVIPLGLLSCAALLTAGIGLLYLKNWARRLSIGYAVYAIVFGLAGAVINFMLLFRPLITEAARQHGPEAYGAIGGALGGTIGGCFGLIYPIVLLVFMTRPKLIAAFRPPVPPPLPPIMGGSV